MMPLPQSQQPIDPGYPVIAACLGDARRPSLAEFRRLARRIRCEVCPDGPIDPALRRRISLAALAALGVTG
jgi:hypothetical protein